MIDNDVFISAVQKSYSVIYLYTFFFVFFSIMVYHKILNILIVFCAIQKNLVAYPFCI